mgnify:CR=1 FL=1
MHFVSPFKSYYERQVAEFQRLHPDIEVRMILVPMSEYHMKFKTLTAARQGPDLFFSGDVWMTYLQPFMADLTPPVALAAFAAAPIAKESGLKIGVRAVQIAIAGFAFGAAFLLFAPLINRFMHGVK